MPFDLDHEYGNHFEDLLDDDLNFGFHPFDLYDPRRLMLASNPIVRRLRYSPYEFNHCHHHVVPRRSSGGQKSLLPAVGKDGFQVCMDVSQFKPKELTVKVVEQTAVVEGKHEEREDGHGMIQRHFVRKYTLPKGFDPNDVVSTVSSDGVLTLKAPPPPSKEQAKSERIVQIQQTGPAHLSVKAPEAGDGKAENGGGEKMETGK